MSPIGSKRLDRNSKMDTPRHIVDEQIHGLRHEAARRHLREERWRRVRSLRLKSWFFSIAWPLAVVILFVASEAGLYSLVQLVPGLDRHEATLYGLIVQSVTWIIFVAGGAYFILSPRNAAWVRGWGRRGLWGMAGQPMQKAKYHARYCAARNRGTAAVFLGFCALEVFSAWRNLNKPLAPEHQLILLIAGLFLCIVVLGSLFLSLTCFGERLALGVGMAVLLLRSVVRIVPSLATEYGSVVRNLSLLLWATAALASLALLKSALRSPAPGASHGS